MPLQAQLIWKRQLTPDVFELEFQVLQPTSFSYQSGNFTTVKVPTRGAPIFRSYTFASAPNQQGTFKLIIKLFHDAAGQPGQGGGYLNSLKIKDQIELLGVFGAQKFATKKQSSEKLLLLGTGTGIAPFHALAQDFTQGQVAREIFLYFGVSYEKDIFYQAELQQLQKNNPDFVYRIALSRPPANYSGLTGRLPAILSQEFPQGLAQGYEAKICGSVPVVQAIEKKLLKLGLPAHKIESSGFGKS